MQRRRLAFQVYGICGALAISCPAFAQQSGQAVQPVSSIRTPASPAFTLLGVEPTAVERPAAPADFAVTLLRQLKDLTTVPKDFAIDVSPYWMAGRPKLTWQAEAKRSLVDSIVRTTSVSVATSRPEDDSPSTGLGVGLRTSLWSGELSAETQKALAERAKALAASGALLLNIAYKNGLGELDRRLALNVTDPASPQVLSPEKYNELKDALLDEAMKSPEYVKAKKAFDALVVSREGFALDVAAAWTWAFPEGTFDSPAFRKWGLWATPSYTRGHLGAVGVVRYISDKVATAEAEVLEIGGRAVVSNDRSMVSLEYVKRSVRSGTTDGKFRLVGIIEHRVGEGAWFTASIGRDRVRADSPGTLVAQLGVAFNVSKERYKIQ